MIGDAHIMILRNLSRLQTVRNTQSSDSLEAWSVIYLIISEMNSSDTWNWWKLICHSTSLQSEESHPLSTTINLTRKSIFNGIAIARERWPGALPPPSQNCVNSDLQTFALYLYVHWNHRHQFPRKLDWRCLKILPTVSFALTNANTTKGFALWMCTQLIYEAISLLVTLFEHLCKLPPGSNK